ncbi:uncharacterized protein LOC115444538 isoform X2 [Manduca sexta]|uniref:uncharacterized protein LOC115444538 isoform X2 n=1 Tax=Manduca sexta TaxID=7130 RepID=UPI001181F92C|nr:uncharacterized protein LOC115444538 isoform X2 [Manduca sexta]
MEGGDGMVAVVRELRDTGLAVTVLDGCRRYTLMPNSASVAHPTPTCIHVSRDVPEPIRAMSEGCTEPPLRCDSSVQATDGRYASMYKVQHCNVSSTSPPNHLAELPPQCAELTPGHDNFNVGGTGSGEKYSPVRLSTQFREGMSWPDRESCTPRPSYEPDSFANSLRKYSNMSPQRSEIVERLVNYTQAKNVSKCFAKSRLSSTRLSECNSNYSFERDSRASPTHHSGYEPKVTIRPRVNTDESLTREERPKTCDMCPELNASAFCRNFETRYLRDVSNSTRDSLRNFAKRNSTSAKIQVVEMMSRQVATLPRVEPSKRNVAVPLSPICSITQRCPEASLAVGSTGSAFKSVQITSKNITEKTRKFAQSTSSSIGLLSAVDKQQCNEHSRIKSKSSEDFRTDMLQLLQSIDCHSDEVYQAFRDEVVRKIKKNRKKLNLGIEDHAKSAPFWIKARSTCRHCVNNCRKAKNSDVFRGQTRNISVPTDDSPQNNIKHWLREVYAQSSELLERHNLDHTVSCLAAKFRRLWCNSNMISKSEIMQMIEEVMFDANDSDRNVQLNNLADALANKIRDILHTNSRQFKKYKRRARTTRNKKIDYFPFRKLIQPTEEEVRGFVKEELLIFMNKFNLNLNAKSIRDIETELIDVLIDSIDELQWGDNDKIKEVVAIALRETSQLPNCYFTELADTLVKRFKSFMRTFSALNMERAEQQTFVILQNTIPNASMLSNDPGNISIEPITVADVEAFIEQYTNQLTQVIEAWWTSILGADENEKGFREVAINDLAGDIVDRHRFLGMNNSLSSNEDEVEYLKFQIFRWINKLVGDEAMQQALERAPELMEQIQKIPVPAMNIPDSSLKAPDKTEYPKNTPLVTSTILSRATPSKAPYNVTQLPARSGGRGRSLSEGSKKRPSTIRRMSEPTSYSLVSVEPGEVIHTPQGRRFSLYPNIVSPIENLNTTGPTISKVNEGFRAYLSDWVNQIPIAENNVQERELSSKLKNGIFNGILVAYLKVEMNPTQFKNEVYLQDYLDKEIEELLSCLPSSQELDQTKPLLKAKLIEHIVIFVKAIININASTSYKYRLWDAITCILPPRPKLEDREKSTAHLFEELLILNLIEDYILYRLHEHMNQAKAEAHRYKVNISIQKLYENAKLLPGNERITEGIDNFTIKVIKCMLQVEIPSRDALQEEGDQIVLGLEIAQWLQDLPIAQSDSHFDQLQKRRLRASLAKKIHEIEKQPNSCDNSAMRQVKNELSKFLEKFTTQPEDAGNLSFLIDEFINRLKNRREKVEKAVAYPWFVQHIPFSSSAVEHSGEIFLPESFDDEWANLGPSGHEASHLLGANLIPGVPPYKEPTNSQWFTLLNTQEQLQRERDARVAQSQVPPCCQPDLASSHRSQAISGYPGQSKQMSHKEPSNVQRHTYVDIQEGIEREKKPLLNQTHSQQVPSCCQPAAATSQGAYGPTGRSIVGSTSRHLHTSQTAGTSYDPLTGARSQVAAPPAASSMHSEMKRLVDLQDQRLSMMHSAIPEFHSGPSGVDSFVPSQAQPVIQMPTVSNVNGIFSTSPIAGPSGVAGSNLAKPKDPSIGGTSLMQRPVLLRQIGSPQQVMSSKSPTNQSQLQRAAPLAQQQAVFTPRHYPEDIPEQNISRPVLSLLENMSIQPPVGFSTPRQSLAGRAGMPEVPDQGNIPRAPRARRKGTCEGDALRADVARRRLDLEEVEEEEERERDEVQCRCTERVYRCRRRRPMCCDCEDMDYPRYFPMPYPYCFY